VWVVRLDLFVGYLVKILLYIIDMGDEYGFPDKLNQKLNEKRDQIVCDFVSQTSPEDMANIKIILTRYQNDPSALKKNVERLQDEITGYQQIINSWRPFGKKIAHENLTTARRKLQPYKDDKMVLDNFFNSYWRYALNLPLDREDRPYSIDSQFFEQFNKCPTPAVNKNTEGASPVNPEEPDDDSEDNIPGMEGGNHKTKKNKYTKKSKKSKKSRNINKVPNNPPYKYVSKKNKTRKNKKK